MITDLHTLHPDIEDSSELEDIREQWERELADLRRDLEALPADANPGRRAPIELEIADRLARLGHGKEAWDLARAVFDTFVGAEDWENAAQACDVLFRADQPGSMAALGQGIWLAVTYPVRPVVSVALLQHLVDETPTDSNVVAVAATVAHYIAAVRGEGKEGDDLVEFTNQLWLLVAGNQGISGQTEFAGWVHHNQLQNPEDFLPRLGEALDNLVKDDWWVDRDALRAKLPAE